MNNLFKINNKLAIVTGSSRGIAKPRFSIGYFCCDLILSKVKNELKEVNTEIERIEEMLYFETDFVDVNEIKEFYKNLSNKRLFPDILINNAGTEEEAFFGSWWEIMDKIIDTNLKGAFLVVNALHCN